MLRTVAQNKLLLCLFSGLLLGFVALALRISPPHSESRLPALRSVQPCPQHADCTPHQANLVEEREEQREGRGDADASRSHADILAYLFTKPNLEQQHLSSTAFISVPHTTSLVHPPTSQAPPAAV